MINNSTFTFLKSLKKNNNKEWFDKNKDKYLAAKDNVSDVVESILTELVKFEKNSPD